jgi:DNA-binding transcriptional LysR family regulator
VDLDLNDLRYFALIAEHGGFTAAERHAGITKSKLSRRVALLEEALGVRLLERTTRRLALTEAGKVFQEHCAAMLVEAQAAANAVEQLRSEPVGTVRLTCTVVMGQFYVAELVASFMRQFPKVRVELNATDRSTNLIEEGYDIGLVPQNLSTGDGGLVARRLASTRLVLVSSPTYVHEHGPIDEPERVLALDTIGSSSHGPEQSWSLVSASGRALSISHRPRLLCSDFTLQYVAARAGVGLALLPLPIALRGIQEGSLVRVAKDWSTPELDIHLVYVSRRGMLPSIRALISYLSLHFPAALAP